MSAVSACPACAAAPLAQEVAKKAVLPPNIYLSLPTIHCAACIGKVERTLSKTHGVDSARVNLSLKRVAIHAPNVSIEHLVDVLNNVGFEAHPLDASQIDPLQDETGRKLLIRLAVAGFAMMNVMLFSVAIWSGATDSTRDLFHMISATISLPAVIFSGQPFFASAGSALRRGGLNMDVPISLAILLAAGMSLFEVLNGGAHAYFDAALSLTFFLLIGRYLDHRTRSAARSAAKELSALEVHTAQLLQNGKAVKTSVKDLCVDDEILIPTGVRVPVDAVLISDAATSDRSFLTGESAAITLHHKDAVHAGEINLGAPFTVRATAVGEDTTLRHVASLVEMAENSRNSYTALADRAARIYAPAVHLLAFGAFAFWLWHSGDARLALNIAVAVLIITCPCALGLAVPAVATAAISKLYAKGFLVKSGTALERLAEVDTAIFDKTGTLTLSGVTPKLANLSDTQAAVAVALAQASDHPASKAVSAALSQIQPAPLSEIREIIGAGVQGIHEGQSVKLGHGHWLGASFEGLGLRIGNNDPTPLPLSETPRPGVTEAIAGLRDKGIAPEILSGDQFHAVSLLANTIGVANFQAGVTATQKHAYLQKLAEQGRKTLMIGDGLNDTASLAAAHASIAPSTALDASRNAADIVMLRDSLAELPLLLAVARATTKLSKQNFAIAAGYNCIAVPIALMGYATPLLAAIAMSASSITVLLNALRVGRVS